MGGDALLGFERSVILKGNQTYSVFLWLLQQFESSVISKGNQTQNRERPDHVLFESSVISKGNQTRIVHPITGIPV